MRNQLSFELTRRIGRYAPRMQFVELFIVPTNTTTDIYYPQHYNGYEDLLSERIDRGEDFVDVQKMKEEDNSGEEITGGYIFKIDKWGDEQDMSEVFTTNYANYIITEPSDEVLTDEKFTYLYDYVTNVEQTLMSPNFTSPAGLHYSDLIDVDSFVDTFIIQELSKNVDAYRLSSYFHKDRSKKMVSGPVWDLDRTYGNELFNTNQPEGFMVTVPNYHVSDVPKFWQHLVTDPNFTAKLKKRWKHLRGDKYKTKNIISLISEYQQQLEDSGAAYRNYNRWGDWYFPFMFWVTENYSTYHIRTVKEWTEKRLEWLDEAIAALP